MRIALGLLLMSFAGPLLRAQGTEAAILLTADKKSYLEDDLRAFSGATFVPRGERVVLRAVMDWPYRWDINGCPGLALRMTLPNGTKRERDVYGHCRPSEESPGKMEIKFDAGHASDWSGLGEYRLRVGLAGGPESNELVIAMDDAADIAREWGATEKGVAADVELDKKTFAPGEDVALYVALENFSASVPIYGKSPVWHPFEALKIEVREANGALVKPTCLRFLQDGGPMGLARYPKGMIVPLEYSLDNMGILPDHEGTFSVVVIWRTYQGTDETCHLCEVPAGFDAKKPYAEVRSQVRTFQVVSGGKTFPGCW